MKPTPQLYEASVIDHEGTRYAMTRTDGGAKRLLVAGNTAGFDGQRAGDSLLGDLSPANAAALRARLPWLNPQPLGAGASFGFGDRMGQATPGHVAALRRAGSAMAPIFAQQSVRENTRIGRTPRQVIDDALWGVFQTGWRDRWGADADHIKEVGHVAPFARAGYTFYTIDPSDFVDNDAGQESADSLRHKLDRLPWGLLQTSYEALASEYRQQAVELDGVVLNFAGDVLPRALAKYGHALAHTVTIADEIKRQMGGAAFDLEMSVDETDTPTSLEEHFFIANELLRRDIPVVSLAPRYGGKFQKGVDYMGDLAEFEAEMVGHAAIMRHFNRYKLSVHTGSDKFSIYGIVNRTTAGRAHVKTAGTSYLEALRVVSAIAPPLFRDILALGHARFETDRKTYFLDCRPENVPLANDLADEALPALLDDFDARQLLHVTFGSALDAYGFQLRAAIAANEAAYEQALIAHFVRHLEPFTATTP